MSTVLITGSNGQLGRSLQQQFKAGRDWEILYADRTTLDLSNGEELEDKLSAIKPGFIINAGAYTNVDKAEEEVEMAYAVNATSLKILSAFCAENNVPVIHFSTDYVYDNKINRPLTEDDPCTPRGIYARSKLAGEQYLADSGAPYWIIRTSWVYAPFGHNFVRSMLRLGKEHDRLTIVDDQIGTPTYTFDLVNLCQEIFNSLSRKDKKTYGVFNFSNEGVCSWYDFALAVFDLFDMDVQVVPIPTSSFPRPAPRPHYSVMNKQKIKSTFDLDIPHWRESLRQCLSILQR